MPMYEAAIGIGGVLVGAIGAYLIQQDSWKKSQLSEAKNLLANVFELIWDEENGFARLKVMFSVVTNTFNDLKIQTDLLSGLEKAAFSCHRDRVESVDEGDPQGGISSRKINKLESEYQKLMDALNKK